MTKFIKVLTSTMLACLTSTAIAASSNGNEPLPTNVKADGFWVANGQLAFGQCPAYPDVVGCTPTHQVPLSDLKIGYGQELLDGHRDAAVTVSLGTDLNGRSVRHGEPYETWPTDMTNFAFDYLDIVAAGGYGNVYFNDQNNTRWFSTQPAGFDSVRIWLKRLNQSLTPSIILPINPEFDFERGETFFTVEVDLTNKAPILVTPYLAFPKQVNRLLPLSYQLVDCPDTVQFHGVLSTNKDSDELFYEDYIAQDTEKTYGLTGTRLVLIRTAADTATSCKIKVAAVPSVYCGELWKHECSSASYGQCRWNRRTDSCNGSNFPVWPDARSVN